jgi:hypothetical protein
LLLVATLALLVESCFGLGNLGLGIVTTGTLARLDTLVMTLGAVSHFALVSGMVKSNGTHLGFELDLGRAIVRNSEHRSSCNKTDDNQQNYELFHSSSPQ